MSTVFNKNVSPGTADASGVMDKAGRVQTAAQQQMAWNRPDTANPWAAQTSNPDGSVSLGFTGPLAGAQQNLTAEALRNMGGATDFGQFNVGSGDDYRTQGIDAAQGQMSDWLAPLQDGFDSSEKQRLLAAGFHEGTPQFDAQMAKGASSAADFRSTIGNQAIGLGGKLGAAQGAQDLLAKQQGLAEALRKRSLPMEQLASMQGLLQQPGANGDNSIMQGATMDLRHYLDNYLGKREGHEAQNAADQQAGLNAGMQLFQSAATLGMGGGGMFNPSKPAGGSPYGKGPLRTI